MGTSPIMTYALDRFVLARRILPPSLLEQIAPQSTIIRTKAGRMLLAFGAASTNVYLVLEGRVQVTLCSAAGNEVVLRDMPAGELFGELAAIDERPRSASIVALDHCVLASIPGDAFRRAVCATPEAALWMARQLVAQVRNLTEKVFELNTMRVPGRLHCELLRLCVPDAAQAAGLIDPAPTHAELAARIGTHREAVTRELRDLARRGIVVQHRRRLTITDLAMLRRLVREVKGELDEPIAAEATWQAAAAPEWALVGAQAATIPY